MQKVWRTTKAEMIIAMKVMSMMLRNDGLMRTGAPLKAKMCTCVHRHTFTSWNQSKMGLEMLL